LPGATIQNGSATPVLSEDQHFRPEDMMVLCPTHHNQATKGAMPVGEQREFKIHAS
jgi:hypothetical protein